MAKRIFPLLAVLTLWTAFAFSAAAQTSDLVKDIRAAYSAAKEKIRLSGGEDGVPCNDATATLQYMVPGTGPRTEVFHCYFELDTDEDGAHYLPYFITRKYNIAAREFYEEYLFEPAAGRLRFAFIQSDTFEGTKNEERYYYDDCGKLATVNIKGERTVDDTSLVINAETLRTLVPKYLDFSY